MTGETADGTISYVESLNRNGITGVLSLLGEHYTDRTAIGPNTDTYVDLVRRLDVMDLDGYVLVKPLRIGLDISGRMLQENLDRIVDAMDTKDVFVQVDVGDHETIGVILNTVDDLGHRTGGNIGVCMQAGLKRARDDLERLTEVPDKVCPVKGVYSEPASIAYKEKSKAGEVYRDLFEQISTEFDGDIAVGSHDPHVIACIRRLHEQCGMPYEIQMLADAREDGQHDLVSAGIGTRQYVPYGGRRFSYFCRYVRERRSDTLFVLRAVAGIRAGTDTQSSRATASQAVSAPLCVSVRATSSSRRPSRRRIRG